MVAPHDRPGAAREDTPLLAGAPAAQAGAAATGAADASGGGAAAGAADAASSGGPAAAAGAGDAGAGDAGAASEGGAAAGADAKAAGGDASTAPAGDAEAAPAGDAVTAPVGGGAAADKPPWTEVLGLVVGYMLKTSATQRVIVLSLFVLKAVSAVLGLVPMFLTKLIVDSIWRNASLPVGSAVVPWRLLLLSFAVSRVSGAVGLASSLLSSSLRRQVSADVTKDMFRHMMGLSLAFHLEQREGSALNALSRASHGVYSLMDSAVFRVYEICLDVVVGCGLLHLVGASPVLLVVGVVVALRIGQTYAETALRRRLQLKAHDVSDRLHDCEYETLNNFETVQTFSREAREIARYRALYDEDIAVDLETRYKTAGLDLLSSFVGTCGRIACILILARQAMPGAEHRLSPGDFVLVQGLYGQLLSPFMGITRQWKRISRALTSSEKALVILKTKSEIVDAPDAIPLPPRPGLVAEGPVPPAIEFRDVSFKYKPDSDGNSTGARLSNLSFSVRDGGTTAIVGKTGSGKTTIIRLLLRLYDAEAGTVFVNGCDVRRVTMRSLRERMGIVEQATVLTKNTLEENIKYACPDATEEEVLEAVSSAALSEYVAEAPRGLKTAVLNRGNRLSGGQRQRVGVARALIKKPDIVLLDEATSKLDSKTEKEVQDGIRRLSKGRTTVVIAHRLSTICHANEILVLHEGRVIERGTHSELLLIEDGTYARMWHIQSNPASISDEIDESGWSAQNPAVDSEKSQA